MLEIILLMMQIMTTSTNANTTTSADGEQILQFIYFTVEEQKAKKKGT